MMAIALAVLIGIVAGLRAMTAPAAAAFAARYGTLAVAGTPLAFMGYTWVAWALGAAAISELVTDQLPSTPSRKVPIQFTARVLTGALSGATLAAPRGALLGAAFRSRLATTFGKDRPAAIIEDIIAIVAAILIVTAPSLMQ
jgi:uncharacterized membrane protein